MTNSLERTVLSHGGVEYTTCDAEQRDPCDGGPHLRAKYLATLVCPISIPGRNFGKNDILRDRKIEATNDHSRPAMN